MQTVETQILHIRNLVVPIVDEHLVEQHDAVISPNDQIPASDAASLHLRLLVPIWPAVVLVILLFVLPAQIEHDREVRVVVLLITHSHHHHVRKQTFLPRQTRFPFEALIQVLGRKRGFFRHPTHQRQAPPQRLQLLLQREVWQLPVEAEEGRHHKRHLRVQQQGVSELHQRGVGVLGDEHVSVEQEEVCGAAMANAEVAEDVDGVVGVEEGSGGGEVHEEGDARLAEGCVVGRAEGALEGWFFLFLHVQNEEDGAAGERDGRGGPGPARGDDREEDQAVHGSGSDQRDVDARAVHGID